jgi:hypothetical protein
MRTGTIVPPHPDTDPENDPLDPAMEPAQIADMLGHPLGATPNGLLTTQIEAATRRSYYASVGDEGSDNAFFIASLIDGSGSGHMAVFTHLYDGIGEDEYDYLWMTDLDAIDAHIKLRYAQWRARIA